MTPQIDRSASEDDEPWDQQHSDAMLQDGELPSLLLNKQRTTTKPLQPPSTNGMQAFWSQLDDDDEQPEDERAAESKRVDDESDDDDEEDEYEALEHKESEEPEPTFCGQSLAELSNFCGGSADVVYTRPTVGAPKLPTEALEEHTAIEVEFVEPLSETRKQAYLTAMARKARQEYAEQVKSSVEPVVEHEEDIYSTFSAAEKRKFVRYINEGLSTTQASKRVVDERDETVGQKRAGRLAFWRKGKAGEEKKEMVPELEMEEETKPALPERSLSTPRPTTRTPRAASTPRASATPLAPPSATRPAAAPLARPAAIPTTPAATPVTRPVAAPVTPAPVPASRSATAPASRSAAAPASRPVAAKETRPAAAPASRSAPVARRSTPPASQATPSPPPATRHATPSAQAPKVSVNKEEEIHARLESIPVKPIQNGEFAMSGINYYDAVRKEQVLELEDTRPISPTSSSGGRAGPFQLLRSVSPKAYAFTTLEEPEEKRAKSVPRARETPSSPIRDVRSVDDEDHEFSVDFEEAPKPVARTVKSLKAQVTDKDMEALERLENELLRPHHGHVEVPQKSRPQTRAIEQKVTTPKSSTTPVAKTVEEPANLERSFVPQASRGPPQSAVPKKAVKSESAVQAAPTARVQAPPIEPKKTVANTKLASNVVDLDTIDDLDNDIDFFLQSTEGAFSEPLDSMSVATGVTGATGLSSYTQSSRVRRPGVAKVRLAKDKHSNPVRSGWHETMKAAAESTHRAWDPKEGWMDYEEPQIDDVEPKSTEKIRVDLASKIGRKPGDDESRVSGEAVEIPFPNEWETERSQMLLESEEKPPVEERRTPFAEAALETKKSTVPARSVKQRSTAAPAKTQSAATQTLDPFSSDLKATSAKPATFSEPVKVVKEKIGEDDKLFFSDSAHERKHAGPVDVDEMDHEFSVGEDESIDWDADSFPMMNNEAQDADPDNVFVASNRNSSQVAVSEAKSPAVSDLGLSDQKESRKSVSSPTVPKLGKNKRDTSPIRTDLNASPVQQSIRQPVPVVTPEGLDTSPPVKGSISRGHIDKPARPSLAIATGVRQKLQYWETQAKKSASFESMPGDSHTSDEEWPSTSLSQSDVTGSNAMHDRTTRGHTEILEDLSRAETEESDARPESIVYGSEAYGPAPEDRKSFFKRIAECAAPIMPGNNDSIPSAHLSFMRNSQRGSSSILPTNLCARPDTVHHEEVTEKASRDCEETIDESRASSRKNSSRSRAPSSVVSEDFGAKTAYLEAIAMKTAVSKPKRSESRRRGRASSSVVSSASSQHSEKWKALLERKRASGASPLGSGRSDASHLSKSAERLAASQVNDLVRRGSTRSRSGRTELSSDGSAEDLAAARVEAMMAALTTSTYDEGEI